jgi:hypothetical protein
VGHSGSIKKPQRKREPFDVIYSDMKDTNWWLAGYSEGDKQ